MNPWKITLLLSYICIASVSAAILTPALPHIAADFHLGSGSVQWIVSIFLLGYVIGQLIYAPIANSFGRLFALRSGLVVNLIGIIICLTSSHFESYFLLLIGRLITALGAASGLACTFLLLNELLEPQAAKHAISYSIFSFTIGIGIAVLIGSFVTQYLHWYDCFYLLFIHGALMLIFSYQFKETLVNSTPIKPTVIFQNYLLAFRSKKLVAYSIIIGFLTLFSYGYAACAPIFAQQSLHMSPSAYGIWNILNMVGMLGCGFLGSLMMKRLQVDTVLKVGLGLISIGILMLITITTLKTHNVLLFFTITSYLYLTTGTLFPAGSYLASTAIADKASASSAMSFINMGSGMLGVIIMGYLPFKIISSFTIVLSVVFLGIVVLCLYAQRQFNP